MTLRGRVDSVERKVGPAPRDWWEMTDDEFADYLAQVISMFSGADPGWTFDELRRLRDMREAIDRGDETPVAEILGMLVRQYWQHVPGFAEMFRSQA